jgi:hypothetical protein
VSNSTASSLLALGLFHQPAQRNRCSARLRAQLLPVTWQERHLPGRQTKLWASPAARVSRHLILAGLRLEPSQYTRIAASQIKVDLSSCRICKDEHNLRRDCLVGMLHGKSNGR